MITSNLFEEVLIKPVSEGADKLLIVSGYATSAMAFHHLEEIRKAHQSIEIDLIIGMPIKDGLSVINHKGFQKIADEDYAGKFRCSYLYKRPPVHSKVYTWMKDNKPFKCFVGSANYSQFAFNVKQDKNKDKSVGGKDLQREILTKCEPDEGFDYFTKLSAETIYCNHLEVENVITIFSDNQYRRRLTVKQSKGKKDLVSLTDDVLTCVEVSLLMDNGEVHNHAGLNWAFRKTFTRSNRNEAYIQLKPHIYKSEFFPPKGVHFTILTDDGKSFIVTRAQKNYGDAIETPQNNGLLGEYFRNRLGLPYGSKVERKDLDNYGRTDVKFCKIDDETYEMDFSV